MIRYFTLDEFKRCSPRCEFSQMDISFMEKLDTARDMAGTPFVLLSAYRSSDYDISRGRSGKGYHTLGRAVDIKCVDGNLRWKIIYSCMRLGLSVGVYKTFLHIDNRLKPTLFYGK